MKGSERTIGLGRSRAYVLVAVLVCLSIVLVLATAWLRTLALERRHVRADARGLQAEFLAASGLSRAAARLAGDASYSGETWRVDRDALDGPAGGTVTIAVAAEPDRPQLRRITVTAEFPDDGVDRVRRTREFALELSRQPGREDASP
ncbi:MAG: hypothetical protein WD845_09455 [Pirellulales bacterium]